MSAEERQEQIDAYLNGELQAEQLKAFEEALQSDEVLRSEVTLLKNIEVVIQDKSALAFQKMVQEQGQLFLQEEVPSTAKVRKIGTRQWAIAATFLLLVVSGVLFWSKFSDSTISGPELFAENFTVYRLNTEMRSGNTTITSFEEGIAQYQSGHYSTASEIFAQLLIANPQDMVLAFCLANAYLNQTPPQLVAAQPLFERIISDGESIYVPRAQWYLALLFLQKEEIEKAKELLLQVATSGDSYADQANDILSKLD